MESYNFDAKRQALLAAGVRMMDPACVYVEDTVEVGAGTLLLPGTILRGGDHTTVNSSQCQDSRVGSRCEIGPYAHLRPHSVVGDGSKIGAFVQLKNCNLGEGTKMAHLTYVGDSDVGPGCNFGCGSVTCNYDGKVKARTTIGANVFIPVSSHQYLWGTERISRRARPSQRMCRNIALSSVGPGRLSSRIGRTSAIEPFPAPAGYRYNPFPFTHRERM